jgi:hypothetical protein
VFPNNLALSFSSYGLGVGVPRLKVMSEFQSNFEAQAVSIQAKANNQISSLLAWMKMQLLEAFFTSQ